MLGRAQPDDQPVSNPFRSEMPKSAESKPNVKRIAINRTGEETKH
jgi:hypothetical protein